MHQFLAQTALIDGIGGLERDWAGQMGRYGLGRLDQLMNVGLDEQVLQEEGQQGDDRHPPSCGVLSR